MEMMMRKKTGSCIYMAARQLRFVFLRVDFWIVIITLAAYFSIALEDTRIYLQSNEFYMGIFSVFPMLIQGRDHLFLILIGYLFLVSDVPEFYPGVDMQILRTSRNIWYCAQWVYQVLLTIVYFFIVQFLELVFLFPQITFTTGWGSDITGSGIFYNVSSDFFARNPVWNWFSASLLVVLLALFFAGVCEVCNLLFQHAGIGVLINTLFLFAYLIYMNGFSLGFISPVEVYARSEASGLTGYCSYYIILCTIVFATGYHCLSRIDIGEKT